MALHIPTDKGKEVKADNDCGEWQYGKCVPNSGDCGLGVREATCNEQTKKYKCKVPCNWKKDFGGIKENVGIVTVLSVCKDLPLNTFFLPFS